MHKTIVFLCPHPLWISLCSLFERKTFTRFSIGDGRGPGGASDHFISEFEKVVGAETRRTKIVELNYYHFLVHNVKMKEFFTRFKDLAVIHVYLESVLQWAARRHRGRVTLSDYTVAYQNSIVHNNAIKEAIPPSRSYHFSLEEMVVRQSEEFTETMADLGLEMDPGSAAAEEMDHGYEVPDEIIELDGRLSQNSYAFVDRPELFLGDEEGKQLIFTVCMGRTGSTFLISLFNSLPETEMYGELLNPPHKDFIPKSAPPAVSNQLGYLLGKVPAPVTGAKFILFQLSSYGLTPEHLSGIGRNVSFIHLQRRSMLEQYISLRLAELSDAWVLLKGDAKAASHDCTFELDGRHFDKFRERYRRANEKIEELFPEALKIYYEDLRDDCQKVFDEQIFPRFGLPPQKVSTPLRKMNTRQPEEIITNWEKVKDLVTPYR